MKKVCFLTTSLLSLIICTEAQQIAQFAKTESEKKAVILEQLPYLYDFENGNMGWQDSTVNPGTSWQLGVPSWNYITASFSPVNAWMVNRTSGYSDYAKCYLISPYFDFNGIDSVKLSFWQNIRTEQGWDGHRLEYSNDNGNNWKVLGVNSDPNGVNWYNDNVLNSSLLPAWTGHSTSTFLNGFPSSTNYNGWINCQYKLLSIPDLNNQINPVLFRFAFTSDASVNAMINSAYSGIAIDDFKLALPCNDIMMLSIDKPINGALEGSVGTPLVTIKNPGSFPITSADIISCITPANTGITTCSTFHWNGLLNPSGTFPVYLSPIVIPLGQYEFCAFAQLTDDCDHSNDTVCVSLKGVPAYSLSNGNFSDSFDSAELGWVSQNYLSGALNTEWELGTPNYGSTTGAHNSLNCWDINLDTSYFENANCMLVSPFFDLSNSINDSLIFWQNYNTENGTDGVRLEYNLNNTATWLVLGSPNDTNTVNWYTSSFISSSHKAAWEGNSGGWIQSSYALSSFGAAALIRFRFIFSSDAFTNADGYSIDDFSIHGTAVSSINEESNNSGIILYPNPANDLLYISFEKELTTESTLSIRSIGGEEVFSKNFTNGKSFDADIKKLEPGIYFTTIIVEGKKYYSKFIKL